MKRQKTALSAKETVRIIARLFDLYGVDRRFNRDRSGDGWRFEYVLHCAVRDGLLRLPPTRGAPSKWKGKLGLELIEAVENIQRAPIRSAVKAGRRLPTNLKLMDVAKAIRALRAHHPDKWGEYLSDDLEKRYYEAKKAWGYSTRLMVLFDQWHEKHPEIYPENS
jgi:hypothetical protein